ncbi:hypothetical protein D3C60_09450 [Bacillus velezensis]|nr:hypothetical protein D3C60_09450 [Bacillus velezensis]EYB37467.1 hypothetical protein AW26_0104175 [Bacillus amyloliquefaciens EBL11]PRS80746.1 hypothetical protein C6355_18925 [Bacillus velezensis]
MPSLSVWPVKMSHVLIIADTLSEKLSFIIHKFSEKESFLRKTRTKKIGVHSCPVFSSSVR